MQISKLIFAGLLSVLALPQLASAQDTWQGIANFDPAVIPCSKGPITDFQIGLSAHRQVNDYVALGFGAAVEENWKFKAGWAFPVFVNAHVEKFGESFTPTFDFRLGYSFSTFQFDHSSFFINPTIGIRYEHYGFGIGYVGGIAQMEGATWASAVNIRLAYYFGYHPTTMSQNLNRTNFGIEFTLDAVSGSNDYQYKPSTGGGVNLSLTYPVSDNLEVGPMVGFHYLPVAEKRRSVPGDNTSESYVWDNDHGSLWIPIAARGRYNVRQATFAGKIYPWIRIDLGARAIIGEEMKGSFYWSPAVGLALDCKDGNHSLDLGVGFTTVNVYKQSPWDTYVDDAGTKNYGVFQVSLGYKF